ncbi:MAG: hypothetical protein H6R07_2037 [Proteobacteria bacterium]|nr:hypothetical protein [Pseudomonadota bacterium]
MSETTISENTVATARSVLKELQKDFPVIRDCLPLAIGIDKQLIAQRPEISRKLLRSALAAHTQSLRYLKELQNASVRFNLDGSNADPVSDEQRALAAKTLRERFKKRAEQRKAQEAAEKAERERAAKLNQLAEKFSRN